MKNNFQSICASDLIDSLEYIIENFGDIPVAMMVDFGSKEIKFSRKIGNDEDSNVVISPIHHLSIRNAGYDKDNMITMITLNNGNYIYPKINKNSTCINDTILS